MLNVLGVPNPKSFEQRIGKMLISTVVEKFLRASKMEILLAVGIISESGAMVFAF